jgi:hypothetical protein
MAIEFTCECEKRFQAKEEYRGRRGMCPQCKREFLIGAPPVIEPELPSRMPPVLPVPVSDATLQRIEDASEPRPLWKDPVVVIGAAIPTIILIAFFTYLAWPKLHSTVDQNSSVSGATTQPQKSPAVNLATLPSQLPTTASVAYKLAVIEAGHLLLPNDPAAILMDKRFIRQKRALRLKKVDMLIPIGVALKLF